MKAQADMGFSFFKNPYKTHNPVVLPDDFFKELDSDSNKVRDILPGTNWAEVIAPKIKEVLDKIENEDEWLTTLDEILEQAKNDRNQSAHEGARYADTQEDMDGYYQDADKDISRLGFQLLRLHKYPNRLLDHKDI